MDTTTTGEEEIEGHQTQLFKPKTKNSYQLDETVSALQKDIRRGNTEQALFWALECFPYYSKYLWKRLLVIAVEDIRDGEVIAQINAMKDAFFWTNDSAKKSTDYKHRIFITKAVLVLCGADKSREADHAQHYIDQVIEKGKLYSIPNYAQDVHTQAGRRSGKTKKDFMIDEEKGLKPYSKEDDEWFNKLTL